jgi:probable LLM family oxidoreductase
MGAMEIGIDSFAAILRDSKTSIDISPAERLANLLQEVETADQVGIDIFGVGEHHRPEFLDSAPAIILAAAAARTKNIRLTSAVTVLSAADPVRVFQDFATVDLISKGRAEMVVGRGSFAEAFPLFGLQREDYDTLFAEKLDLLLKLREATHIHWSGRYRPALTGQGVYPRPHQAELPIWLGVGGTPASFARAGTLGLPLMIGIIGGGFHQFRPLVDLYRAAWKRAGHPPEREKVGVHAFGFIAATSEEARDAFFPGWLHIFAEVGRDRGWSPPTRAQFDALCDPEGSFMIGDPATVAAKVLAANEVFGGIARITFQMSSAVMEHETMKRSIQLLGTEVAPLVRQAIAAPEPASAIGQWSSGTVNLAAGRLAG